MYRNSQNFGVFKEIRVDTMVMSDFRPEVEILPFHACAVKFVQCNSYLWPNRRNFCILWEIRVKEHDGVIRFKSGSGNMAILCRHNTSSHNYRNSLFIVDLAMGQMPRSTERISSLLKGLVNTDTESLLWHMFSLCK